MRTYHTHDQAAPFELQLRRARSLCPGAERSPVASEMAAFNPESKADHREIALDHTLCFDIACSNHLMVSPPLRGSNPYPCGSLTYRILLIYCRTDRPVCQPFGL